MKKSLISLTTLASVIAVASLPVIPVMAASAPYLGSASSYGIVDINTPVAAQVRTDINAAYNFLIGQPCNQDLTNQDLNNMLLNPGVYCFTTPTTLAGQIKLNGYNNPNSVFVFRFTSSFTLNSFAQIVPMYSARPENIYFQIGDSLYISSGTLFKGNAFAQNNIVLTNGASVEGRLYTITGTIQATFGLVSITCPTCNTNTYYYDNQWPTVLVCSPVNQTVNAGQATTLTATGGNGSYTWSAADLQLTNPMGPNFTVTYAQVGTHTVIVTSNGEASTCTINVAGGTVLGASTNLPGLPNTGFGGNAMLLVYFLWAIILTLTGVHIFGFRKARAY